MKYEESIKELETLVRQIEQNELDIDSLAKNIKKAKVLLAQCHDQLTKIKQEVEEQLDSQP